MIKTDIDLISKYNVQGPRYTSYPSALQFRDIDPEKLPAPTGGRYSQPRNLSLYFHIPFCFSLCWFCGCTKIITKERDRGDIYLDYLEKEMDLIAATLNGGSKVIQIHFGGGSPTFLDSGQLLRLGAAIRKRFTLDEQVEYSVEIDPRNCSREQVRALREIGCNRASLGIQDTNSEVQEAIHRIQPLEVTEQVTSWLREYGFQGINFDLIYGLPRQTLATFRQTISDVLSLHPDRLAVYSYAHLPGLMPAQRLLNEEEFPSAQEKLNMIRFSIDALPLNGYRFIGMDHFAKEGDELVDALDNGTLQRNFQGYSTRPNADMIALGMSGISMVENSYYQNTRDLAEYYRLLDQNRLPVVKKLDLSLDDRIRRDLIMQIMCRGEVDFRLFSGKWNIGFLDYFWSELKNLQPLEDDGLVLRHHDSLQITDLGRLFLRNICMVFDACMKSPSGKRNFSKTV